MDETGLSEKGKRCQGGKKPKQRLTKAFFVNASGGKEDTVIGKSVKPQCFKSLKDKGPPYSCHYFANKKAWMTELFKDILAQLNQCMKHHNCNIIHHCLQATLATSNSPSQSQPLNTRIIKQWKVKTKQMLLHYVYSKVDGKTMASEITKSVHLLMLIQWGK